MFWKSGDRVKINFNCHLKDEQGVVSFVKDYYVCVLLKNVPGDWFFLPEELRPVMFVV